MDDRRMTTRMIPWAMALLVSLLTQPILSEIPEVEIAGPPLLPPDVADPQFVDGLELPSFTPSEQRGHFEQGVWPEKLTRQLEIEWVETMLKELGSDEEDMATRISLEEAYSNMICVFPKEEWYVPDYIFERQAAEAIVASAWRIVADCSERTVTVYHEGEEVARYTGLEYARNGFGDKINSGKTPLGEWTITKEPEHRYGPSFRLSGYQGLNRGILLHQDLTKDRGSNGCLHLPTSSMNKIFELVPAGAVLVIQK